MHKHYDNYMSILYCDKHQMQYVTYCNFNNVCKIFIKFVKEMYENVHSLKSFAQQMNNKRHVVHFITLYL